MTPIPYTFEQLKEHIKELNDSDNVSPVSDEVQELVEKWGAQNELKLCYVRYGKGVTFMFSEIK